MPELPEVQTVVSDLNKKIKGDKVVSFWSDWKKSIKKPSFAKFQKQIRNKKVLVVRRIGKNIFIDLSQGYTLYIHLKMTGHLLVKSQIQKNKPQINSKSQNKNSKQKDYFDEKVNQYIHHIWTFESGKNLEFSDVRKFGKIVLGKTKDIEELPEIKKLGIDALSSRFNFSKFKEVIEKRKESLIGIVLMDQNLISGIGNIYRSEILFEAGILPQRKIEKLSESEKKEIFLNIKKILKKAVKMRGTSDSDYRDTDGAPGKFQKVLKVYRKKDEKCERCGTIIMRDKMGQRSFFFCPKCQK